MPLVQRHPCMIIATQDIVDGFCSPEDRLFNLGIIPPEQMLLCGEFKKFGETITALLARVQEVLEMSKRIG